MAVASGARCAQHPDVTAVDVCQRCGTFLCGDCLEIQGSRSLCAACLARGGPGHASAQAVASLVLGAFGVSCGLVWGIAGLILAYREIRAIERDEAPEAGLEMAKIGKILGWINVALIALVGLAAMYVFLLRRS